MSSQLDSLSAKVDSLSEPNHSSSQFSSIYSKLTTFPQMLILFIPIILMAVLVYMKPNIITYTPDKSRPNYRKISYKKVVMYGGVGGCILGVAIYYYMNRQVSVKV